MCPALIVLALTVPSAAAQPALCPSPAGQGATVIVRAVPPTPGPNVVIPEQGAVVRIYDSGGQCVGEAPWDGVSPAALTVWGDDQMTPEKDGAADGEVLTVTVGGAVPEAVTPVLAEAYGSPNIETSAPLTYHSGAVFVVGHFIRPASPPLQATLRVFLQGPYDPGAGGMRADLLEAGVLPPSSPFDRLEYDGTPLEYNRPWAPPDSFWAARPDVVDYVLIELRETEAGPPAATRPALVVSDGSVVDLDGAAVAFDSTARGSYYVVVRHRNHLGVMSAAPVDFESGAGTYDFTASAAAASGGTLSQAEVAPGVFALWSGDYDGDGAVTEADVLPYLTAFGNAARGYVQADGSLDGVVTSADYTSYLNASLAQPVSGIPATVGTPARRRSSSL